ncbi:MAG TPA: glycosyltransferase [Sedimentisphaerales bacterium]|nr:glycosyltransferase [Sedimentisphaerales bacterium]
MTMEPKSNPLGGQTGDTECGNANLYEKGLQLAGAGRYQDALACMREHLRTSPQDAQILNDIGAILHCLGRSDEAIDHFLRARSLRKDSPEIVWNLVEAYLAVGKANEAASLFDDLERMNVLNVDVLNRAANIFLNQNNKAGAVETLLRSLRLCPGQEILQPMLQVIRSKRPKLAFFCGGDGMGFLDEIVEFARPRFEVRLFDGRTEEELYELMKWSDVSWFEWCTNLAVIGSRQPKVCKNIIRLHRYEAYELWPRQVNWANIDQLVTVGNSFVREVLLDGVPQLESTTSVIGIPNGVSLDKFPFTARRKGKNIAFLANLRTVKNPPFVLQCMQKLHYIDRQYRLFFGGKFQDTALEQYLRHMVAALDLRDVVFFDGWQPDVRSWLADKHYIVSTSIIESQGMGVLEAMACGVKPVIHNFPGAAETFPSEFLFNIAEEFCAQICSEAYEPERYRKFVEERYALQNQLARINNIFTRFEAEIDSRCTDTGHTVSPDWNRERVTRSQDALSPAYGKNAIV